MRAFPFRWPIVVTITLIVAFWASILFIEGRVANVEDEVENIVLNATPSIAALGAARSDVRRLQFRLSRAINARLEGMPLDRAPLAALHDDIEASFRDYERSPFFPGEGALYTGVVQAKNEFYAEVERAIARIDAGKPEDLHALVGGSLDTVVQHADESIEHLIAFNNEHAHANAMRIRQVRRHAARVSLLLDGAIGTLGLVLLGFGVRTSRTYRRALDEWRRARESQVAELDRFASRVAHDLRGPLNSMLLGIEYARAAPARAADALARAQRAGRLMATLVDALLELARAGTRPPPDAATPVAPVVAAVVETSEARATDAHVTIAVEPVPPTTTVACTPGTLASVITNYLDNAIKFTADQDGERQVTLRVVEQAPYVRIEVEDTGPGLPDGMEERVFDLYVRGDGSRGKAGLGLGLATVKRLAEVHGGRCGARASAQRGTCFWIELPSRSSSTVAAV